MTRQQIVWAPIKDSILMEAIANGATFERAGQLAHVTRDQAASRFRRLKERMGWQAV